MAVPTGTVADRSRSSTTFSALPNLENMLDREICNVIQLGFGLCLLFTAYNSQGFVVEPAMANHHEEDPRFSKHAGYYSTIIASSSFLVSNIVTPPIIKFLTPKWSLVVSTAGLSVYMGGFLFLNPYFLYASAVLMGFCGGIMWAASGCYLAQNSNEKTIGRNSGIMWIIYMTSMIIGGFFLLVMFSRSDETKISAALTRNLYGGFLAFVLASIVCFALLQQKSNSEKDEEEEKEKEGGGHLNELKKSFDLFKTLDMIVLFPLFAFTGILPSFYGVIYTTAISFTSSFNANSNILVAWCSILTGVGQIAAGLPLILLGKRANRFGFAPMVLFGCIASAVASVLVLINIPGNASFEKTDKSSLITPSIPIALLAGCIFGISDCMINTATYAFLSTRYPNETTQAFAILKFFHAIPLIVCIYSGTFMELQWQLLLLVSFAFLAFIGFLIAEKRFNKTKN